MRSTAVAKFGVISDIQFAECATCFLVVKVVKVKITGTFDFLSLCGNSIPDGHSHGGVPRYYRAALPSLQRAVAAWQALDLDFVIHLGAVLQHPPALFVSLFRATECPGTVLPHSG